MLDQCAAIHMAPDRDWSTRCGEIVHEAGVGECYPFLGIEDIARRVRKTPVQFLIVNFRLDTDLLTQTIAQVRHHHEPGVKFMPIIVFTRDSSAATAFHFLKMGCDDIITFPSTTIYLADRLAHQIGRKIEYVHAGSYFGLDRPNLRDENGSDVSEHYIIHRDTAHGVKILVQNKKPARQAG